MDPISLIFYALVCGLLGLAGPKLGKAPMRLAVGACVGILAATALPGLRALIGL